MGLLLAWVVVAWWTDRWQWWCLVVWYVHVGFGLQDWLVGWSDWWSLVGASDCKVFFGFRCFGWSKLLDLWRRLTKNAEHNDVGWGWGWVLGCCCCVYFKFLGLFFSCGFDDFFGFMGLIFWRFWWRIKILNEFLHVYLLRKCIKRKENIDYFNFLGNHTCFSRSFTKNMKNMLLCSSENNEKKKRKKN